MSMFSGIEKDEPSSRGIFGRLRALRTGFAEESASSMPIAGVGSQPESDREPRFVGKSKPIKAEPVDVKPGQPMTLGMRLRMADITDVDVDEDDSQRAAAADLTQREAFDHPHPVAHTPATAPSAEVLSSDEHVAATMPAAAPASAVESHVDESVLPLAEGRDDLPPIGPVNEVHEARAHADLVAQQAEILQSGLPELVAADALTFKRILSERGQDATLRITDAARREFVAVADQSPIAHQPIPSYAAPTIRLRDAIATLNGQLQSNRRGG
jgi:hypothetical protein